MLSGQWLPLVIPALRGPKKECCPKLEAILRTEILMRGRKRVEEKGEKGGRLSLNLYFIVNNVKFHRKISKYIKANGP